MHDICSPSQLHRRAVCPGSAREEEKAIKKYGESAGEKQEDVFSDSSIGTMQHKMASDAIKGETNFHVLPEEPLRSEMESRVAFALRTVNEKRESFPEKQASEISEFNIALDSMGISGGTIDWGLIGETKICFADFKFGAGFVQHPKNNLQFKAYSVGLYRAFGVSEIEAIKIQPQSDLPILSHVFTEAELLDSESEIKVIVQNSLAPESPLRVSEECHFCKAKFDCPARKQVVAGIPFDIALEDHLKSIDSTERAKLWENIGVAIEWLEKAKFVMSEKFLNREITMEGYEIGEGKKRREWMNPETVYPELLQIAAALEKNPEGLKREVVASPAEAEKIFGKSVKAVDLMSKIVNVVPGKPTPKKIYKK